VAERAKEPTRAVYDDHRSEMLRAGLAGEHYDAGWGPGDVPAALVARAGGLGLPLPLLVEMVRTFLPDGAEDVLDSLEAVGGTPDSWRGAAEELSASPRAARAGIWTRLLGDLEPGP
jgi:hypothetical protein